LIPLERAEGREPKLGGKKEHSVQNEKQKTTTKNTKNKKKNKKHKPKTPPKKKKKKKKKNKKTPGQKQHNIRRW